MTPDDDRRLATAAEIAAVIGEWQFRAALQRAGVEIKRTGTNPSGLTRKQTARVNEAARQLGFELPTVQEGEDKGGILRPREPNNPAFRRRSRQAYGRQVLDQSWVIKAFVTLLLMDADLVPAEGRFESSVPARGRPRKDAFRQLRIRLQERWESNFGVYDPDEMSPEGHKLAPRALNGVWILVRRYCGSPVENPRDGLREAQEALAPAPQAIEALLSPEEREAIFSTSARKRRV